MVQADNVDWPTAWDATWLQIIGRPLDEQGVLNAGLAIEERAGFSERPKKWW